ncbi:hypothetical protein Hypma_007849 [Hypsizygus marmoreus]|uniref:Uncharacterized protein n=1 Tax=Hypsizygus marmoreus TaxID=39966 RepID=A0A369K128_HYPMA|nr:hypothetical protein Hypma_007849 [Hypsizygus marmoreus]
MSPALTRRDCDAFGNNCNGVRPTTYAASVAIVVLFVLFAGCFVLRRRRRSRRDLFITSTPLRSAAPAPLSAQHPSYQPPLPFEPAPPYEPPKAPPPPHTPAQPDASGPPVPPDTSTVPNTPAPPAPTVQYPPPSYSPA